MLPLSAVRKIGCLFLYLNLWQNSSVFDLFVVIESVIVDAVVLRYLRSSDFVTMVMSRVDVCRKFAVLTGYYLPFEAVTTDWTWFEVAFVVMQCIFPE